MDKKSIRQRVNNMVFIHSKDAIPEMIVQR